MNYLYPTYILVLSLSSSSFAQIDSSKTSMQLDNLIKLPNADASHAIEIKDSIAGPFNVSSGYGLKKELIPIRREDEMYDENNSAWFKFTVEHNAELTFDIVPFNSTDDYDFTLYKCQGAAYKDSNGSSNLKIVRFGWSHKPGGTGLSRFALGEDARFNGAPYVSSINVTAGETYYLMIDYGQEYLSMRKPPQGFMIYFYDYNPQRKPVVFNNLLFETGKAILQKESFPELDKLAGALLSSQAVIEIRGHTDNVGNEKENQKLSEERAKAVVDYLISKKVDNKRLHYKGFGSTRPVAPNTTEEGRQKNRRVEFVKMMY